MESMNQTDISTYLDEQGRVTAWPSKQAKKQAVVEYMATHFETGRVYTEKEVNAILNQWHTFNDYFLLRRALIESGLMTRDRKGSAYQRTEEK